MSTNYEDLSRLISDKYLYLASSQTDHLDNDSFSKRFSQRIIVSLMIISAHLAW